ncbi:hypothetical protein FRAAL2648 [Frankia alni ACN14a]|uniref:Uncharacterized protein n=1 Tax=Frankia alni (strain DSM 45986 / CECT 9034 / ACN14a) TaxID=326424 RepID=Q0RMF7_FRAAA|nr:hypothetical protein FRAAL2648 [Frankia alni ACN14a]
MLAPTAPAPRWRQSDKEAAWNGSVRFTQLSTPTSEPVSKYSLNYSRSPKVGLR